MAKKDAASARRTYLTLPTYTRQPARQLPGVFQQWGGAYPDTTDDLLGGPRRDVDYDAIILENAHLRLTILPELGGKIFSVFDKNAGKDAVHVPDVIKPGLIHRSGAWIAGGLEFNFPIGHYVRTMRPTACHIEQAGPEVASAVVHRACGRTGLTLDAHVILRAGEARFDIAYTAANPTALSHRWYHWTNVGVTAGPNWRFFCKAALYTTGSVVHPYPIDEFGVDTSWSRNRDIGSDSFMVAHREEWFGCYDYDRGHGLAHLAPCSEMLGKKYFTWGWKYRDFSDGEVFSDSGQLYNEIQSGPLETQMDFEILAPGGSRRYHETWMPYRDIGGIEWANQDLLLMVLDGEAMAYAARDLEMDVRIDGQRTLRRVAAGRPIKLAGQVKTGSRIEVRIDGQLQRAFAYPLEGRQEKGGEARVRDRFRVKPHVPAKTAAEHLSAARSFVLHDVMPMAITHFRKSLSLDARQSQARLELAEAYWRTGDFAAGSAELAKLAKTSLAKAAREILSRQGQVEQAFMAPVLAAPAGVPRELALAERLAGYGAFDKALAMYRRLEQAEPANPRVLYGLAKYFWNIKDDRLKALGYAERALAACPGDRDLIVEFAPLYTQSAAYAPLVELIESAPADVRNIHVCLKALAKAHFELGQYDKCWAILARRKIDNWEGELSHADTYIDCALAMAEEAVARGDFASAARWAQSAGTIPPTLGMPTRRLSTPRWGYWLGLALARAGKADQARQAWRQAVDGFVAERAVTEPVYGDNWWWYSTAETFYFYDLCKLASGEQAGKPAGERVGKPASAKRPGLCREVLDIRRRLGRRDRWLFLEALAAEVEGTFPQARSLMQRALKESSDKRVIVLHLEALAKGLRRAE